MNWGYCRVSSEEQLEGVSIDSQFRRLADKGIPEDQILVEVGSASKGRTPELHRLFKLAREGKVKSILAIRQDRFQRNRRTAAAMWELIDVHKVAFRFLDQPDIDPADPTSVLQAQILGAFAQFETEQSSQRIKNGLEQNRVMKKHHGRAPAGYIGVGGHLKPDPETWDVYREVVESYLESGSSTAARRLRFERLGQRWGVSSFARWITSPAIRGSVVWGTTTGKNEVFPNQHQALITSAEWDQIQSIRASNLKNTGAFRAKAKPSIGSGLFRCSSCGGRLAHKKRSSASAAAYVCSTSKGVGCEQGYLNFVKAVEVADEIRRAIRVMAAQLAEHTTPQVLPESQALADLRVERQTLKKMKTARAERMLAEVDSEIAAEESRLKVDAPERQKLVRAEFLRLSDEEELQQMSDEELRSMAVRHGLQITVDLKKVVHMEWKGLGLLFPFAAGDLSVLDIPVTRVLDAEQVLAEVAAARSGKQLP